MKSLDKSLAEDSLSEYVRQAWHVVEPQTEYLHNWHIDLICEHLELITKAGIGKDEPTPDDILRLIINIPPRYMKSLLVSVFWPTWVWIKYPWTRWIFASYSASLSKKHSIDRRTVIQSEWYQRNWGSVYQLSEDQNEKMAYENTQRGHMVATSIGGTATGKGGNFIVTDDPHNPKQTESETQRLSAIDFFDRTLSTRLDDKRHGAMLVIMQRLHEVDLTGHLLSLGGWSQLSIPAIAEGRLVVQFPSGREIVREDGSLLWEAREGEVEMEKARVAMGAYSFAGQMQQRPSPAGGGMLKKHWWRFWQYAGQSLAPIVTRLEDGDYFECPVMTIPAVMNQEIQSWDMAFKDTKASAYVVGQVWKRDRANKFLVDQFRDKVDFVGTIRAVRDVTLRHPSAEAKLVEDKANGPAVISTLQSEISGLIPIEPNGSKEARASAVSPQIESGNVYLPHPSNAPWVEGFIERCAQFPNGAYADEQDALSQALNYFPKHGMENAEIYIGEARRTVEYLG